MVSPVLDEGPGCAARVREDTRRGWGVRLVEQLSDRWCVRHGEPKCGSNAIAGEVVPLGLRHRASLQRLSDSNTNALPAATARPRRNRGADRPGRHRECSRGRSRRKNESQLAPAV